MITLSNATESLPLSILILFTSLCNIATTLFRRLNQDIFNSMTFDSTGSLERWRQCHRMICQLTFTIDRCFGPILLIAIGSCSINLITSSFEIYLAFTANIGRINEIRWLTLFFKHVLLFWTIVYQSHRIQVEVTRVT